MPFYWEGGVYDPPREKKGVNPYKDDPKKLMNLNVILMNLYELQLINMPVTPDNYNKECDKLRSYSEVVQNTGSDAFWACVAKGPKLQLLLI